jgi:flagellar hook-length control protein FliK
MALEGLPSAVPAPAAGAPVTGMITGATAAPAPALDETLPLNFLSVLTGTLVTATAASSGEAAPPAVDSSTDTPDDDEIGFEDLSEFLTQVLVPGVNPSPAPQPAPVDSDATVELDFSQGDARGGGDLSEMFSAMTSAPADSKLPAGSSELLRDALAAEKQDFASLVSLPAADTAAVVDVNAGESLSASPLHAASVHHVTHNSGTQTMTAEIRSPVGTQAWNDEVGNQITWMAQQGRESASLKLTPEHLGPIEVRINVQDGQTSVWFGAANADTRAAIEQALPRLRELFSAQGLSLADSGVFQHAPHQQQQAAGFSGTGARDGMTSEEISGVTPVAKRGAGILDLYA